MKSKAIALMMTLLFLANILAVAIPEPALCVRVRNRPPARGYSRMVYDAKSEKVYMFGGFSEFGWWMDILDVWAYDPHGKSWQQVGELDSLDYDALAFDSQSRKVIVYQPFAVEGVETWAYDIESNTWENMNPTDQPSWRMGSRMVYDAESDRVILFSGADLDTGEMLEETWSYDYESNTWINLQPTVSPSPRVFYDVVYHPEVDRIVMFGGETAVDDVFVLLDDTWEYDYNSNTWTELQPSVAPTSRCYHSMAYDRRSNQIFIFGGVLNETDWPYEPTIDETWAYDYDVNIWKQLSPKKSPSERSWQQMVGTKNEVIMFGGGPSRWTYTNETWSYNSRSNKWKEINVP